MRKMKLAMISAVVCVCAAFTVSSTPVMSIQTEAYVKCAQDWEVDGFAKTSVSEVGHVWVGVEWVLKDGLDGGVVAASGDWDDRDGTWVQVDVHDSGGAFFGDYPVLEWWTYHDAEVGVALQHLSDKSGLP